MRETDVYFVGWYKVLLRKRKHLLGTGHAKVNLRPVGNERASHEVKSGNKIPCRGKSKFKALKWVDAHLETAKKMVHPEERGQSREAQKLAIPKSGHSQGHVDRKGKSS